MSEAKRDLSWEALIEVCGYAEEVTQTERGRINAALKELRAIYPESTDYAIAVDIHSRAAVYARKFPGMEVTPQAIVGNWSRLDPFEDKDKVPMVEKPSNEPCSTCNDHRMVLYNVRADASEEYAPCPDCHPAPSKAGYWRNDPDSQSGRSHLNPPDPVKIRAAMIRLLEAASHAD